MRVTKEQRAAYHPLHPFPARMAPDVVQQVLPSEGGRLRILDPMMGSGTTLIWSRIKGHEAFGVDRDPLAVAIARASTTDFDRDQFVLESEVLLERARRAARTLRQADWYPVGADEETKTYVRYWFDPVSRRQLSALMRCLRRGRFSTANWLHLVISRMIVTKSHGVSLALDVSHSRPHRHKEWTASPITPFDAFDKHVRAIAKRALFTKDNPGYGPEPKIDFGDCRALPYRDGFFDYVITSPPYLNAIDYLRGHKLSLVWFGHRASEIRELRSSNVGADRGVDDSTWDDIVYGMIDASEKVAIPRTLLNRVRRYARDLDQMVSEIARVTRSGGRILFVVGDCTIKGTNVLNSKGIAAVAKRHGLVLTSTETRPLPSHKRYLPPPSAVTARAQITKRMWNEVILQFISPKD